MPTVSESTVTAFAHCAMPICPGNAQQPVQAVKRVNSFSYIERGGDLPGEEMSTEHFAFADPADVPCPECGRDRELTDKPRPQYDALSGFDPNYLVSVMAAGPAVGDSPESERIAALEAKLAALLEEKD